MKPVGRAGRGSWLIGLAVCLALGACKEEAPSSKSSTALLPDLADLAPPPPGKAALPTPAAPAQVQAPTVASVVEPTPQAPVPTAVQAPTKAKPERFAKSNKVAGEYSRYALGQGKYWESIVAQVEGYRPGFYRDNKGLAVGYGFNASFQTKATNRRAGLEVLKNEQAAQTLESLSGQLDQATLPAIQVNPEQAMGMSLLLKPGYENPMRKWIPGFEQLKPNQQAVLVYHAYKTGAGGAMKYGTLKSKIAAMLANPTPETTRAAGAQFQYTYRVGTEVKTDTRSIVYMQALWNDPQAYADLIGGKSSSFVATLPEFKNTGKSSVSDDDIDDPVGEVKLEMERTGRRIPMTIEERSRPNGRAVFIPNF